MLHALARRVTAHARLVLSLTVLAVIAAGAFGFTVFSNLGTGGYADPGSESAQATALVDRDFGGSADLVFLVRDRDRNGSVDSPAATQAGDQLTEDLTADSALTSVTSYFTTHASTLRSRDGAGGIVLAQLPGPQEEKDKKATKVLDRYDHRSNDTVQVLIGGPSGTDLGGRISKDIELAEAIAVPLTLLLLIVVFGSVMSALLPLAVALMSILGSLAILNGLTQFTHVSVFAINLVTALGLGLGVDYALLLLSRYREELRGGATTRQAVITAVGTAGRTIAFSAVTVLLALSSMLAFPPYFLKSFAYAGIAVVVTALIAALVVLPALLVVLGPKVESGRVRRRRQPQSGPLATASRWGSLAAGVMRRPILVMVPVLAVLALLAVPLFGLHSGNPDDRVLPASAPAHQVGDALRTGFDTDTASALDIVVTNTNAAATDELARRISQIDGVALVDTAAGGWRHGSTDAGAAPNPALISGTAQRVVASLAVDPASEAAETVVDRVRDLAHPGSSRVLVGGPTAVLIDNTAAITDHAWLAVLVIIASTFVLLFLFTGSIVHPLRAVIGNLITLSATLGVMVWIFQEGHLDSLLGFTPQPLNLSMLVLSACVAFGLSMDYEVFLLGRIKEARDHGHSSDDAVVIGVSRTGQIITSCAALLAISFFAFVTGSVSLIQLFGLATGLAIIIDATLVRIVLIPATMRLLGERAWYAPAPLRRVHAAIGLAD